MPVPRVTAARVFARDGFRCRRCASEDHLAIDHIKPRSAGGGDDLGNLQVLCRSCNSRKGGVRPQRRAAIDHQYRQSAPPVHGDKVQLDRAAVARRLGIKPQSVTVQVRRGSLPGPDGRLAGRSPWWWSTTLDEWKRPGRTGRPRRSPTDQPEEGQDR